MRISDDVKLCTVIILFNGVRVGTGFFLGMPSRVVEGGSYAYIATCRHNIEKYIGEELTIEFPGVDKKPVLLGGKNLVWEYHEDEEVDVAIANIGNLPNTIARRAIPEEMFLLASGFEQHGIGIGDEIFFPGLFTRLKEISQPIIRTGTLAMLPEGKVIPTSNSGGKKHFMEGYLVDQRSLGGFSGCPVFVRETIALQVNKPDGLANLNGNGSAYLLGMMHGHWKVEAEDANEPTPERGNFPIGLSIVIPASKILDVLNCPDFKQSREEMEARLEEKRLDTISATPTSYGGPLISSAEASHKERFDQLLEAAVRQKKAD